jgi:hypothetical protein
VSGRSRTRHLVGRLRGEQSIPDLLARGLNPSGNFYAARHIDIDGQCARPTEPTSARSVAVGNPARVVASTDEIRERHERLMERTTLIDVAPAEATPSQRLELQAALREHGAVYVP